MARSVARGSLQSRGEARLNRTLVMIDEAASLGPLQEVSRGDSLLRSRGVQLWTFWQNLSQLKQMYPAEWQTHLDNCGVIQTCGFGTPAVAREWSELLGRPASSLQQYDGSGALQ